MNAEGREARHSAEGEIVGVVWVALKHASIARLYDTPMIFKRMAWTVISQLYFLRRDWQIHRHILY